MWTPPLRELTPETSLGFECIEFAENILELDLMPWQKWFLIHALELNPDEVGEDGGPLFRFRKLVLLVGRQNGKSTVMQALTLWRMYVDRCSLVIGTAQDLEIAESLWAECVDMAEEVDELKAEILRVDRGSGKKALRLRSGETYKVKAASRRGGRGLSGELVLLDELREHQTWHAWGAVTKTTNAKERAQVYGISNAGDASSLVLRHLRMKAHAKVGDPDGLNEQIAADDLLPPDDDPEDLDLGDDDESLGIFEWSAKPGCGLWNRDGWAQANPALGYRIRESTLASDAATDPEWVFRTEVLCQWSDGTLEGPFPPGAWEKCSDSQSKVAASSPLVLAVAMSWDRSTTHIGLAGFRDDGLPHIGMIASRHGTEWLVPWLTDDEMSPLADEAAAKRVQGVVLQAKGAGESNLAEALREGGLNVIEWGGADLGLATGNFYDRVRAAVGEGTADNGLRHLPQPLLDVAAATAVPRMLDGGAMVWDRRRSPTDVAPLIAVTGALWALTRPTEKPARSAYEERGLEVV